MTVVFEAQPFIIFARDFACRVCSDDFIIIVRESRLLTSLCMDDVVERVASIIDSMRSAKTDDLSMEEMLEGYPYKRYTKAEMNAMLDKAEANFEAGRGIPDEEAWDDLEEELALEKQELEMAEAI